LIRSRYPGCIRADIPCYFLFFREEELQAAVNHCQDAGIEARPVPIQQVRRREPILENSRLAFAARVPDTSFDSSRLLQEVVNAACEKGVQFHAVASLAAIKPAWDGKFWHLPLDAESEIICEATVLACGVYIPEMLGRFIPGAASNFKRTKNPVLVLRGQVASSILIPVREPHSPYLVPFNGAGGSGATVCLTRTDEDIADPYDNTLPARYLETHAESLSDFYPGISAKVMQGHRISAHFYSCQKLYLQEDFNSNNSNRRPFCLSYAPQANGQKNIFVVYPGKFTTALLAAQICMHEIEQSRGNLRGNGYERLTTIPAITRQKYYDPPQYVLSERNGRLIFDPRI